MKIFFKIGLLLHVLSMLPTSLFAQKQGKALVDSILQELPKAKIDTNKVVLLSVLSANYARIDPHEGIRNGNDALQLAEKLSWKKGISSAANSIGVNYLSTNDYPNALACFNRALKINEELGFKKGISTNIGNIGIIYSVQGDYNRALNCYEKALKMDEETGNKKGIARNTGNISRIYHRLNNYSEALNYGYEALRMCQENGDTKSEAGMTADIGTVYRYEGNYPKALEAYFSALKLFEQLGDKNGTANTYNDIGNVYSLLYDYANALKYYFEGMEIDEETANKNGVSNVTGNIGQIYLKQKNYPKALEYTNKALAINEEIKFKSGAADNNANIGEIYCLQGSYEKALPFFFTAMKLYDEIDDRYGVLSVYDNIGTLYAMQKKNHLAIQNEKSALHIAREINARDKMKLCYEHLTEAYRQSGNYKNALVCSDSSYAIRDSLFSKENNKKMVQLQMQYDFDKKEASIKAEGDKKELIASAEIARQKTTRRNIIGASILLLVAGSSSFVFYKRKRDADQVKKDAEFKAQVTETELKALRAQMNPHFIFNSLNSISDYISRNETETAREYLAKFAELMRLILENSEQQEVPLAEDLQALKWYMQLEAARMEHAFIYSIHIDDGIDAETVLIPPMILQPFVENSIWHGLSRKNGNGWIKIRIGKEDDFLCCIVEDNGIGRSSIKNDNNARKPLGMKITQSRLDIINRQKHTKALIALTDLPEGTRAEIKLPLLHQF